MDETRARPKFKYLLATLVLLLVSLPLLQGTHAGVVVLQILFSAVLIAGMYAASARRFLLLAAVVLAAPALLATWTRGPGQHPAVMTTGLVTSIGLLGLVGMVIISSTVRQPRVTRDTIYAALAVYLLIGIGFAFVYSLIALRSPEAFQGPLSETMVAMESMTSPRQFTAVVYYSLVTLTTLGYGDILPVMAEARLVSSLEAVFGQFYVATVVGWLVGRQVSQTMMRSAKPTADQQERAHQQEIS
jgi:hypothetical protein